MATERTPLQPVNEFNEILREEDTDQSLYTVLMQRPFVAAFAFALFCLLLLIGQAFSQLAVYDWQSIPQFTIKSVELAPSHSSQSLLLSVSGRLELNTSGAQGTLIKKAGEILGSVSVEFEQTQVQYQGEHLVFADIQGAHRINTSGPTDIEFKIKVHDIGNSHTLQHLMDTVLHGLPANFTVKGATAVSKLGIPWRVAYSRDLSYGIDDGKSPETGSIENVMVSYGNSGLGFDILTTFFAQTPFRLSASIPPTDWKVKLQDCEGDLHQICSGHADELFLEMDQDNNVTVNALMHHLPGDMIAICQNTGKSSVDTLISKYLSGQHNHIYVEGSCKDPDSFIGRALDGLNINVPISGKPTDDKLVDSVQVREVRVGTNGEFSGEATVAIHLPQILDVDSSAVIGAQNIRGEIILSHLGVEFGKIVLNKWNPCVTTQVQKDYLVEVYFNSVPFEVLNAREAAIVSQQLMMVGSVPVKYDAVLDVDIMSPIAQFFITDFAISGKTVLER